MRLITNESELRDYIPNAFTTVKGETTLLKKLAPFLESGELWLKQYITGEAMMTLICGRPSTDTMRSIATHIVVNEAMRQAVPSLDLVLTPNGFGIVSNSNIAPASKERVERLIASLEDTRDDYVEQLIKLMGCEEAWQGSPQYRFYTSTLFPNLDLAVLCGFNEHRWRNYRALRNQVQLMENMMAEEYISHEQMMKLREIQVKGSYTTMQLVVISTLRNIIINKINGKNIPHQMILRDIVNTFRKHPEEFPEWHASSIAALFNPPVFENKKENRGYWF